MININKLTVKKLFFIFILIVIFAINHNKVFADVDAYCMNPDKGCSDIEYINTSNPSSRSEDYYNGKSTFFLFDKNDDNYVKFFNNTASKLSYTESFARSDTMDKDTNFSLATKYETGTKVDNFSSIDPDNGDVKTYNNIMDKGNNSTFYKAFPENVQKLDSTWNKTTNAVDYAIKISSTPIDKNTNYFGQYSRSEKGYKISGGLYYSFNRLSSSAASGIISNCKTDTRNGTIYRAYISKVLAIRDKDGNFLTNIDNKVKAQNATNDNWGGTSHAFDDLFNIKYNINIPIVKKTVIVLYKYRNEVTGKFETPPKNIETLTCKSGDEIAIDPVKAVTQQKGNAKYIGFKVISGDSLDENVSDTTLLASTNDGGYNVKSGVKITDDTKATTVIAYYYDERQVEINHVLLDSVGNVVKTIKTDKDGNPSNSVINIPLGTDYTINSFGSTYTDSGTKKSYSLYDAKKWTADTLSLATAKRDANGTTSTWGSNTIQTTLMAINYGEKGTKFKLSSGAAVNFYYKEGSPSNSRSVFIRHVDQNGNVIGTNASEIISGSSYKNGYNTYSGISSSPLLENEENFIIKSTDNMKISALTNYKYSEYKIGNGSNKQEADSNKLKSSKDTRIPPINLVADTSIRCTSIDLIYTVGNPGDNTSTSGGTQEETIPLVGTLAYVNNPADSSSSAYSSSTASESVDYIPSGKSLKAYVSRAYPYYFRRADLEKRLNDAEIERDILKKALGIISKSGR
jgi:hypothetical protein